MVRRFPWRQGVIFLSGLLLLIGTWYLLYLCLMMITEIWLVPWDMWAEPVRPPLGVPARTVNDFFESGFGSHLPAVIVVAASLGLFIYRAAHSKTNRLLLPWLFAGFNFIFTLGSLMLAFAGWQLADWWLPQPRPEIDVGYHRTWPMIVGTIILLISLLIAQAKTDLVWRRLSPSQQGGLLILGGLVCLGVGWFFAARLLLFL